MSRRRVVTAEIGLVAAALVIAAVIVVSVLRLFGVPAEVVVMALVLPGVLAALLGYLLSQLRGGPVDGDRGAAA